MSGLELAGFFLTLPFSYTKCQTPVFPEERSSKLHRKEAAQRMLFSFCAWQPISLYSIALTSY